MNSAWPNSLPSFHGQGARRPAGGAAPQAGELSEWIDLLGQGNINANRDGSPDLLGQLRASMDQNIQSVIISALDSDPALRFHAALAAHWPREVVAGARFLGRITRAAQVQLVMEREAPAEFDRELRGIAFDNSVRIVELPNEYPQSDPTLLTYTLTGRRLRRGELPPSRGVLIADAAAALLLGQWIAGEGAGEWRPCAILDHRTGRSAYLWVPVDTPLWQALATGHFHQEGAAALRGDLLRLHRAGWDERIDNGELVVHLIQSDPPPIPSPCIRCGWCVEVCPTGVHPARLLEAAQRRSAGLARRAGGRACIECGVCDFVCPANLPLLEAFRGME